jgi:hypothetical protein
LPPSSSLVSSVQIWEFRIKNHKINPVSQYARA